MRALSFCLFAALVAPGFIGACTQDFSAPFAQSGSDPEENGAAPPSGAQGSGRAPEAGPSLVGDGASAGDEGGPSFPSGEAGALTPPACATTCTGGSCGLACGETCTCESPGGTPCGANDAHCSSTCAGSLGSSCSVACAAGGAGCDLTCSGRSCELLCTDGPCSLHCGPNQACYLRCGGSGSCDIHCDSQQEPTRCQSGGGAEDSFVCGRACP